MTNHDIRKMEKEEVIKWCKSKKIDPYKSPLDRQIEWAIEKVHGYLQTHPENTVHIRRLHYWLGSRKLIFPCQIINKTHGRIAEIIDNEGNGWRTYQLSNLLNRHLTIALTEARYRKLIDWRLITDKRNPEIRHDWYQNDMEINTGYEIDNDFYFSVKEAPSKSNLRLREYKLPNNPLDSRYRFYGYSDKEIEDFEYLEYIKNFSADIDFLKGKNNLNMYYIAFIIEKSTLEERFDELCKRYGIDFFPCQGFAGTRRIFEICEKAEEIRKPLLILYLADRDKSGEDMPKSMDKNINRAYPHPHNKVIRIGLNEDQIIKYNLPREHTKGGTKTELDALDSNLMLQIVKEAFIENTKYAHKTRKIRNNRIKYGTKIKNKSMIKRMENVDSIRENSEFEEYQDDMENWIEEYNKLKQKEKKFRTLFTKHVWKPAKKKIQEITNKYNKYLDSFNELNLENPDKETLETIQENIENKFSELFDEYIEKFHIEKLL